jgi:hypothetical protein
MHSTLTAALTVESAMPGRTQAAVTAASTPTAAQVPDSSPPGPKYDLLIVTPQAFLKPMRRLADWKTGTGLSTGILTLEDAYRTCTGRDTPEQVKRCLSLYQKQSGIRFAMLVGDANLFPVRYFSVDVIDETSQHNIEYHPADLYYADLYEADGSFDDWNANGNELFGELESPGTFNVDQADTIPDISVGRVPVLSIEEAEIYVDKVINYESAAQGSDWVKRTLLIVTGGLFPDDCKHEEKVVPLFGSGREFVRLYNADNTCRKTDAITVDTIIAELNKGVGLVSFLGHGTFYLWADALSVKDFSNLHNGEKLPVVFAGGCNTGDFTVIAPGGSYTDINGVDHVQGEKFTSTPPPPAPLQSNNNIDGIMEETLVQMKDGFSAYIGAVTFGNFGPMFDLNEYFLTGIAKGEPTVGEAWNFSVRTIFETPYVPESSKSDPTGPMFRFYQPWIFMLFGDPSLRLDGVANSKT